MLAVESEEAGEFMHTPGGWRRGELARRRERNARGRGARERRFRARRRPPRSCRALASGPVQCKASASVAAFRRSREGGNLFVRRGQIGSSLTEQTGTVPTATNVAPASRYSIAISRSGASTSAALLVARTVWIPLRIASRTRGAAGLPSRPVDAGQAEEHAVYAACIRNRGEVTQAGFVLHLYQHAQFLRHRRQIVGDTVPARRQRTADVPNAPRRVAPCGDRVGGLLRCFDHRQQQALCADIGQLLD